MLQWWRTLVLYCSSIVNMVPRADQAASPEYIKGNRNVEIYREIKKKKKLLNRFICQG